jgi:hypothetical protein
MGRAAIAAGCTPTAMIVDMPRVPQRSRHVEADVRRTKGTALDDN